MVFLKITTTLQSRIVHIFLFTVTLLFIDYWGSIYILYPLNDFIPIDSWTDRVHVCRPFSYTVTSVQITWNDKSILVSCFCCERNVKFKHEFISQHNWWSSLRSAFKSCRFHSKVRIERLWIGMITETKRLISKLNLKMK